MDRQDLLRRVADENIRTVRFLYCDHGNIVRGKAVHASALSDFLESGVGLTVAMQAFTLTEHLASGTRLGPVGEIRLVPDRRTFAVLPYAPREARLLCDMYTLDGQPWELCPRAFLRQTIDRVAEQGLRIEAAFEYEFYLARQADDGRFVPADDSLCFSSDGMDRAGTVVGAIVAAGLDGIQRGLDPGEPLTSNPHDMDEAEREARGIRRYPSNLADALSELEQDQVLLDALGSARAREFMAVRRAEWNDLGHAPVTQQIAAHFRRY